MSDDAGIALFAAPRRKKRPRDAMGDAGGTRPPAAAAAPVTPPSVDDDADFKQLGVSEWLCR